MHSKPIKPNQLPHNLLIAAIVGGIVASSAWAQQANLTPSDTTMVLTDNTLLAPLQVPPPPSVFPGGATPFEDPLGVNPAVLRGAMQYPSNLYSGEIASCATADYASQAHSAQQAAQRLYERTPQPEPPQEPAPQGTQHPTQSSPTHPIPEVTLLLALDLGLCHNPQVRGAWSDIRLQASAVGQARAAYLPTLNAAITRQRSDTDYSNNKNTVVLSSSGYLSMSWRILDFGGRRAALESANYQLAGAIYTQNATLQQTIIDIVQAYYDAQTAKATWQARQEMTQLASQTQASAQRRLQHGVGSQNDVLQASSALARAQLDESRSQGDYHKSMASLTYLLGLPASTPIILASTLDHDMSAMANPEIKQQQRILIDHALQDWLDQAKLHNPAIAAARAQWQAAESHIETVRAQGRPTIDLSTNYYRNGRPTDSASTTRSSEHNMAITLNIPLFSGFDHTYRVRGAQAQAQAQRARMEMVEQQTLLSLVQAHADAQSAWNNLQAADELYTAAELASASAQRQFDKGAVDITQVIQSQNSLIEARLQRIQVQAQWQSARLILVVQGYAWERAGR